MSAVISECGRYRYRLERELFDYKVIPGCEPFTMGVIMVNPSTADHTLDDATIRRVRRLCGDLGANRVIVGNLFAFRSPNVQDLKHHDILGEDVVGPDNPFYLNKLFEESKFGGVVVGFGNYSKIPTGLDFVLDDLAVMADKHKTPLECWGTNKDGSPKHPLYLPGDSELREWRGWE